MLLGSALFLMLGFLLWVLALIADMLGRQRTLLEQVLLNQRMDQDARRPAAAGGAGAGPQAPQEEGKAG